MTSEDVREQDARVLPRWFRWTTVAYVAVCTALVPLYSIPPQSPRTELAKMILGIITIPSSILPAAIAWGGMVAPPVDATSLDMLRVIGVWTVVVVGQVLLIRTLVLHLRNRKYRP